MTTGDSQRLGVQRCCTFRIALPSGQGKKSTEVWINCWTGEVLKSQKC